MSTISKSAVVQAFLVDHRKFMKLLREVGLLLEAGKVAEARAAGVELNKLAGPHIAFEEQVLYPSLDERRDDAAFVAQLYDEHQAVLAALSRLIDEDELKPADLGELQSAFIAGLEHAEHCGTLISNLSQMSEADQADALDELKQLRGSGVTWTELKKDA